MSQNYYLSRGTLTGNIIRYSDCLLQWHLIEQHKKKVGDIKYINPFPPANQINLGLVEPIKAMKFMRSIGLTHLEKGASMGISLGNTKRQNADSIAEFMLALDVF